MLAAVAEVGRQIMEIIDAVEPSTSDTINNYQLSEGWLYQALCDPDRFETERIYDYLPLVGVNSFFPSLLQNGVCWHNRFKHN